MKNRTLLDKTGNMTRQQALAREAAMPDRFD